MPWLQEEADDAEKLEKTSGEVRASDPAYPVAVSGDLFPPGRVPLLRIRDQRGQTRYSVSVIFFFFLLVTLLCTRLASLIFRARVFESDVIVSHSFFLRHVFPTSLSEKKTSCALCATFD